MTADCLSAADQSAFPETPVRVVLFSGGRGGDTLVQRLAGDPQIHLTIAINGYDDGASTGEVRRFLGDCLGPSDFRKNASRVARELQASPEALTRALDFRLPAICPPETALTLFAVCRGEAPPTSELDHQLGGLLRDMNTEARAEFIGALGAFEREYRSSGRAFEFGDCALGNLVFAGCFLECGRDFNAAVDRYSALCGLPPGIIENVTDGTDAYLVALAEGGEVLATEAEIVDARRRNVVREIYLIRNRLSPDDVRRLSQASFEAADGVLSERSASLRLNPGLADQIGRADLVIFAPGTQHSSLFPSYLTPGLSTAIAGNLVATKLLVTNIQTDAEIAGSSAVDIVERAVFYLKEKGRRSVPTPALITHYLINDPGQPDSERPYVPLGRLDSLDDPRLVRIGHYEDGVSGRHDASKLLAPFLAAFTARRRPPRVAVVLQDVGSINKLWQTLLEMMRGGVATQAAAVTVFHGGGEALDPDFARQLPFPVVHVAGDEGAWDLAVRQRLLTEGFQFVVLFESSGMYRGEDIASLIAPLIPGRLDAVWGSRRLSVRDIEESQQLRYRHHLARRALSGIGSYSLSLAYLVFYGRYISDTLSGARAVRTSILEGADAPLSDKQINQILLSELMRRRAEIQEVYVRFVPLSPERVKRTTVLDGLRSLGTILTRRLARRPAPAPSAAPVS